MLSSSRVKHLGLPMFRKLIWNKKWKHAWCALTLLLSINAGLAAQSLDPNTPAPIRRNTLTGRIAARDLGDSRLTDHYYAFTGIPGDLLITVTSQNLNGDLDVFTAGTLRPLLKLTLYAESSAPVTKGIYLRKREDLILRIEARSPNDDEGIYQLSFGGSFVAIPGGPDIAENEAPTTEPVATSGNRKTKRVNSVGARLPEPEPSPGEVAAAPEPTPEATPTATPTESPSTGTSETTGAAPKSTASRPNPRGRRTAGRRTTTPTPVKPKVAETPTVEDTTKTEEKAETTETAKPKTNARGTTRRGSTAATRTAKSEPAATAPPAAAEPEAGPRLIIETNDGTLINRSMSTIRRVIVEGGLVVVTGKDGKIDRIPLMNVVRMSIAQ